MSLRNNIWGKFRWKWYLGRKETNCKSLVTEEYLVNPEITRWLVWPEQSGQRGKDIGDDVICVRWGHLYFSLPHSFVYFGYSLRISLCQSYLYTCPILFIWTSSSLRRVQSYSSLYPLCTLFLLFWYNRYT